MDATRGPDPTLTRHAKVGPFGHAVVIGDRWRLPAVAHRPYLSSLSAGLVPFCGARLGRFSGDWTAFPTEHARWVARPCRRCFRGAPRPGRHRPDDAHIAAGLTWQIPTRR